ncbi:hypothetical protein WJX72_011723 [[Myrmecia] bisecta]|uniref:FAD dependent oxidoreductase domain-containing protein n=1 Tax=[Myrmecia] bisecta TaxID=41462 RepID=A0AAW1NYR1_9CHLO
MGAPEPQGSRSCSGCSCSRQDSYDVLIVGGGVAGIAAAYALAQDAPHLRVAVLEKDTCAHSKSSSYGDSRMYRRMYSVEYFSLMQSEALKLWQALERRSGRKLLYQHGLLFYGETDTGETVQGSVPNAKAVMEKLNIPHTYFPSAHQLNGKWPMRAPEGSVGVFEPGAGSVHASLAVELMKRYAEEGGVQVLTGVEVTHISVPLPSQVCVRTKAGRQLTAKRVILAVGAWTNDLLAHVNVRLNLEIWNMHWGHYYVDPQLRAQYPQWYCFGKGRPATWDGGLFYGFAAENSEPMVKVGVDFAPDLPLFRTSSMADFRWEPHPIICKLLDDFLKQHWRGFQGPKKMFCSPYTMTSDCYFVLDRVPHHPEICVFTGGSGRAFKFAPLLGRCLADLALDRQPSYDITPLKMTREAVWLRSKL